MIDKTQQTIKEEKNDDKTDQSIQLLINCNCQEFCFENKSKGCFYLKKIINKTKIEFQHQ